MFCVLAVFCQELSCSAFQLYFSRDALTRGHLSTRRVVFRVPPLRPTLRRLPDSTELRINLIAGLFRYLPNGVVERLLRGVLQATKNRALVSLVVCRVPGRTRLTPRVVVRQPTSRVVCLVLPLTAIYRVRRADLRVDCRRDAR